MGRACPCRDCAESSRPARFSSSSIGWLDLVPRAFRRHEATLAVANEIAASHACKRLAQDWPVVRIVVAQEGLVQPTPGFSFDHGHVAFCLPLDAAQRIVPGVVHGGCQGHGRGQEGLNLVGTEPVALAP